MHKFASIQAVFGEKYKFVVVGLVALLSASCDTKQDQAEWWRGEQERLELSQTLKLKQFRFELSGHEEWVALEPLLLSNQESGKLIKTLQQTRADLEREVHSLQDTLVAFRADFIQSQRRSAIGTSFEEFSSGDGRVFQNARIVDIDDAGVTIRHDDGSARLRYGDLDARQREMFGLEQSSAQAAIAEEARQASAYESWVDGQVAVVREKQALASAAALRSQEAAKRSRELAVSRELVAAANRPLAQPSTSLGNRYSTYYSGNYSTLRPARNSYRYVYYNQSPSYSYGYNPYRRVSQSLPRPQPSACPPANMSRSQSFSNTTLPYIP